MTTEAKGDKQPICHIRSVEGWVIFASGVHQDAQEDDVREKFADFGKLRNVHLNLDRRTGYTKGYALIEYDSESDAQYAIQSMNCKKFFGKELVVDWAFIGTSRVDTFAGRGLRGRR